MKVKREGFLPVSITLDTQEEVDALYTILNCGPVVSIFEPLFEAYSQLQPFVDMPVCNDLHRKLVASLKEFK